MLENKVAVVTGGCGGIGRATALILAENGAKVVISDKKTEGSESLLEEIKSLGGEAIVVKADISKKEKVDELFKKAVEKFGKIDILVNNAGVLKDSLILMTPEEDYDFIMNANLKGSYLCMQRAAKIMMRQKGGKIINLSSIVGRYGNSGQAVYAASKSGVIGLTLSAAKELGNFGIMVNAVAPGIIDTNMTTDLKQEIKDKLVDSVALKRMGKPEDVAKVILFLASDLSDYVSGQVIGVDGCQII